MEEPFWKEFQRIARERGLSVNELAGLVDEKRGMESGLASALRVFVLENALHRE